jgi:phosphonoacetaldehyde hydrolase
VKIANTTGFARALMRDLIPLAEAGGYRPDVWMCPDDVGAGRPAPWMIFEAARRLGVYPMSAIVKVGDTPIDVREAHAAGVWSVSVLRHGNEIGLPRAAVEALPEAEWEQRALAARTRLLAEQPHFIIERTADLLPVLDDIDRRLREGEKP